MPYLANMQRAPKYSCTNLKSLLDKVYTYEEEKEKEKERKKSSKEKELSASEA